jgi:hypothetical protein
VDVEKERDAAAQGDGDFPDEAAQSADATEFYGLVEESGGRLELRQAAAHEGLAGEGATRGQLHDGLEDDAEVIGRNHGANGSERLSRLSDVGLTHGDRVRRDLGGPELGDVEVALLHAVSPGACEKPGGPIPDGPGARVINIEYLNTRTMGIALWILEQKLASCWFGGTVRPVVRPAGLTLA